MKNSTKFVWIVLGAIAVVMIVLTVMVRSIIGEHIVVSNGGKNGSEHSFNFSSESSGDHITREYDLEGFNELQVVGGWDILVVADDNFSVVVEASEKAIGDLEVDKSGDSLVMALDYRKKADLNEFHGASATIHMPVLNTVDIDGAINMNVDGFTGDQISFKLDGAGQIVGVSCRLEQLNVASNGAVNVDFSDSETRNADVNIEGAGNIVLNMTGGKLTGVLAGLSNLEYSGDVSLLDVKKDGIGGINHK